MRVFAFAVLGMGCALALAGCPGGNTSLLLEIDGPASASSVDVSVTVAAGGNLSTMLPLGNGKSLPGRIIVELPDVATTVEIDVTAHVGNDTLHAHAVATSKVNRQVKVPIALMVPGTDLAGIDFAGVDLNGVDFQVPVDFAAGPGDMAVPADGAVANDLTTGPTAPVARVITTAYYTDSSGVTYASPGMTHEAFSVPTAGIQNGDLVLFIANVDNGSDSVWPVPSGFTLLIEHFYYAHDGQTYVLMWKRANNEPAQYTGTYNSPGSSSATITLLAITGAHATKPIDGFFATDDTVNALMNPVVATTTGLTTKSNNCLVLFAAGSDWTPQTDTVTFSYPTGFTELTGFGDHGDNHWEWTTQMVGWKNQAVAGPTGTLTGTMTATSRTGNAWSAVIAIAPP